MPTVRVRDIDVYYESNMDESNTDEVGGGRERVLFIGGSGGDLRQKPTVFSGPLAKRFELLAYDQRGLGRTTKPDRAYTMEDYAEDAAGLLDALGWERCALMGVSFGGMVAQELAIRHPDRFAKVVLACTSSGGAGQSSYPLHELATLPDDDRITRTLEAGDSRCNAEWRSRNPDALAAAKKLMLARGNAGDAGADAAMGARRQLEARRGHDTWDRLPTLPMPVFLCGGEYDGIAPPANLEAIRDQVPNAELALFEGGHMFLVQDRSAWDAIIEFLEGP